YRLLMESDKLSDENDHALDYVYHQTVKKVTNDYETLGFNTAISQMMIFVNEAYKANTLYRPYAESLVKMLSCIAPHLGEEMWQLLGHNESIAYQTWPTYDESMLVLSTVEMAIQVNGKLRAKITVNKDEDDEVVKATALSQENVKTHTDGMNIVKVIVVKNKIVNIVVKP
ncbi:MAG: class I tRNA ligase family protein, partial [Coprobacillus sp.]